MRFVPASCLREGMKVAKTLYGKNGEKLLIAGICLTKKNIESLQRKKFPGLYINDNLSNDIEIINTISEELRVETMNGIKKLFTAAKDKTDPGEKVRSVMQMVDSIIDELLASKNMMVNMIDLKYFDNYTYLHSVNVAVLSIVIGIAMGLDRNMLSRLGMSAILHDIGKVFVSKKIINKPGTLTDKEYEEVKKHAQLGYKYTKARFTLQPIIYTGIIDHHERYNGTGYPGGLRGSEISLFGRIIAVADNYDALTSERPYRKALSPSEAMEYVLGGVESLFDPRVSTVFIRKVAPYPVGTTVRLSNGCTAIVLENFEAVCLRPRVRVIREGGRDVAPYEINLMSDLSCLNIVIEGNEINEDAF